jgi:hypothetical protein
MAEELGLELELPDLSLETPDTDENELENTDEVEETDSDETPAADGEQADAEEPADGRKLPDAVRKALKAFKESSPENAAAAKQLNDAYGRAEAYKAVFPKVADAQAAQAALHTVEGLGGVAGVQAALSELEEVDAALAAGDLSAVEKIAEVAGEGFDKIAAGMIDKLETANPEAYAAAIRPHLVKAIASTGLSGAFNKVIEDLQMSKTPGATSEFSKTFEDKAIKGLARIHQFLDNLGKPVEKSADAADPQAAKLTAREQALATKEAAAFTSDVRTHSDSKVGPLFSKVVTPYLNKLPTKEAREDFKQGVWDEVGKLCKADKPYQDQLKALYGMKKQDAAKIAQHMANKFAQVGATAAKNVSARRYGKAAPVVAKGNKPGTPGATVSKGAGSIASPIKVKELPSRADVDFSKTSEAMIMKGIRVLKTGKVVQLID